SAAQLAPETAYQLTVVTEGGAGGGHGGLCGDGRKTPQARFPLPLWERVPERRRSRARAGEGSAWPSTPTPHPAHLRYRSGSPPSPTRGEGKERMSLRRGGNYAPAIRSIASASLTSSSVTPPASCVESVTSTVL